MDNRTICLLWAEYLPESLRSLDINVGGHSPFSNPAAAMLGQSMDRMIERYRGGEDKTLITALDDMARIFLVHCQSIGDFAEFIRQGAIVIAAFTDGALPAIADDIMQKALGRAEHWQGILKSIGGSYSPKGEALARRAGRIAPDPGEVHA